MLPTPQILLVAINARYSHSSFAARTLKANLGALQKQATIMESDLNITPLQLASQIVAARPDIVAFSAYLWNIQLLEATARILRITAPQLQLVIGGPELTPTYPQAALFDQVIIGEGETALRHFCSTFQKASTPSPRPRGKITVCPPETLTDVALPYQLYTTGDLQQRVVYVESSRGCPQSCAYCTSANSGLRLIPLTTLLPAFDSLWQRGLRHFKFLDRSFNLPLEHCCAIMDFFLQRATPEMQLHFEIHPTYLHPEVAQRIAAFPAASLHLEAGIQTLNPEVAQRVGRSPDIERTLTNLHFLTCQTSALVHADLIFGLPGEDKASFAAGFNRLIAQCAPPEVQVNLLKGLPGTRLVNEAAALGLAFNPAPPYEVLHSDRLDFMALTRMQNFARCWELVHNRNHFPAEVKTLHTLAAGDYYSLYQSLTSRVMAAEGKMFAISRPRLSAIIHDFIANYQLPTSP